MDNVYLAIQVVMMPKDANPLPAVLDPMVPGKDFYVPHLSIFGGVILSYIDHKRRALLKE